MPELGIIYTITGPDGTKAVINNRADSDFVGFLTEDGLAGLEAPEVRESAENNVEADGGIHGNFYAGRRPFVVQFTMDQLGSAFVTAESKVKRASRAYRVDGELKWTPTGGAERFLNFRRQGLRMAGRRPKTVNLNLVSERAIVLSKAETTYGPTAFNTNQTVANNGDIDTPLRFQITGPIVNPAITLTSDPALPKIQVLTTLIGGDTLDISVLDHTVIKNLVTNLYSVYDFPNSTWWALPPGTGQTVKLTGTGSSGATTLTTFKRDAWE